MSFASNCHRSSHRSCFIGGEMEESTKGVCGVILPQGGACWRCRGRISACRWLELCHMVISSYSTCWETRGFCLRIELGLLGSVCKEEVDIHMGSSRHSLLQINANALRLHLLIQDACRLADLLKREIIHTQFPYCPLCRVTGKRGGPIYIFSWKPAYSRKSFLVILYFCVGGLFFPLYLWLLVAFAIICLSVVFFVFILNSWVHGLVFFTRVRKFSFTISSNISAIHSLFPFFLGPHWCIVSAFFFLTLF